MRRSGLRIIGCALLVVLSGSAALRATESTEPHGELSRDCGDCHSADGWTPLRDPLPFSHRDTGFELRGAHARAVCKDCHPALRFAEARAECLACHEGDVQRALEPPHAGFPTTCRDCHSESAWEPASFDHNLTGFALSGAHRTVSCADCHRQGYSGTPSDCASCHQSDFAGATQPSHAGFPTTCRDCHSESAWEPASFDHNLTGFTLSGAHRTATCADCHRQGYSGTPSDCASCHQADFAGATQPSHAGFPTTCRDCHSESAWEPASFDHAQTSFPLRGAHQTTACLDCHRQGYAGTPSDCFACHQSDFTGATQPSHAGFPTTCRDCHSESAWEPASFNHSQTSFPLRGAHQAVVCIDCHRQGYAGTPTDCYLCHQTDFAGANQPPHTGFPTTCRACHSENAWEPATFNHSQTGFPLTGAHVQASCVSCHSGGYSGTPTSCYSCHQSDYQTTTDPNHQAAGFPTTCESCHDTTAWDRATFNHSQYFPINSGPHQLACNQCHVNPATFSTFECTLCHEHRRTETDAEHDEVPGYVYASQACYQCHPNGRD